MFEKILLSTTGMHYPVIIVSDPASQSTMTAIQNYEYQGSMNYVLNIDASLPDLKAGDMVIVTQMVGKATINYGAPTAFELSASANPGIASKAIFEAVMTNTVLQWKLVSSPSSTSIVNNVNDITNEVLMGSNVVFYPVSLTTAGEVKTINILNSGFTSDIKGHELLITLQRTATASDGVLNIVTEAGSGVEGIQYHGCPTDGSVGITHNTNHVASIRLVINNTGLIASGGYGYWKDKDNTDILVFPSFI